MLNYGEVLGANPAIRSISSRILAPIGARFFVYKEKPIQNSTFNII